MPKTFQEIILTLQQYWSERDCIIWQPYYTQVGAGTMNPATSLRVLGPEPWRVAYVEPSVRPDDGRYGDNPNRFQLHYQFQVILKPDPGNPQELYLQSLQALGIDPQEHDIRFVEDNWESPALGAWGLGWEVWLDGQEITQFTYFQQAGGMPLDPISVEITYGLERIAIALHGVEEAWQIPWNERISYGELRKIEEVEHSRYYFDIADVENLHEMYRLYETEARTALAQGLVLPAHEYVLKLSHTFNILDTRGAIGVTERQAFFKNMRGLSRAVAEAYIAQREALGHPWMVAGDVAAAEEPAHPGRSQLPDSPADLVVEIGTEELPPADAQAAIAQIEIAAKTLLEGARLEHDSVRVYATPRRLVLHVKDLSPMQPDIEQVFRGPPYDRAFDAEGGPTKAAEGFARSRGVTVDDLIVQEVNGGKYVAAIVSQQGRPAAEVLQQGLGELVEGLKFGKSMRWDASGWAFSRPVRWLLALHGEAVIPFQAGSLTAGRCTRSHRFLEPEIMEVRNPEAYFKALSAQGIVLDPSLRREEIARQVMATAERIGGVPRLEDDLLEEVAFLVEAPRALAGKFDEQALSLPPEVLISVMKKHQRYFPVQKPAGGLLPNFITVRSGGQHGDDLVIQGNEHVLRARFADAAFFVENDRKQPLESYLPRLDTLTFQAELGSMLDKTRRIEELVTALAPRFHLSQEEEDLAKTAAHLCKADLATSMVVEMTSLQGVMGRYYALDSGVAEEAAKAIAEHYAPRFAGDRSPSNRPGLVVGVADRLDSLVGLFAVGLSPSGNKDPFGLRRAAMGLVQMLVDWEMAFDLRSALRIAANRQPVPVSEETREEVLAFIVERQRSALLDTGWRFDVVDAVLSETGHNPFRANCNVKELQAWVQRANWSEILPAYSRCVRITRDVSETYPVHADALTDKEERDLLTALEMAEANRGDADSVDAFLTAFEPMIPAINAFFDQVLVMADDPAVRNNRLGLLQRIARLADGVADMSRLEGF